MNREERITLAGLSPHCFNGLSMPVANDESNAIPRPPSRVRFEQRTRIHEIRAALQQQSSAHLRFAMPQTNV